jgi:ABC-type branched-subunit amino acid transport system permease subunit
MSPDTQYYVTLLLVYASVAAIACWGLDIQFGDTGILNFSFILSHAVGAYTVALLTLGPPETGGETLTQEYFWGADLPFPLPFIGAMLAGALISVPIGYVALRKLRSDYQAVAMLSVALIASALVVSAPKLLGGGLGLYLIPAPLKEELGLDSVTYAWLFAGFSILLAGFACWVSVRVSRTPLGRVLRAVRDNPEAADALGKDITRLRMGSFALGNSLGALSGAVLVSFLGTWSPSDWMYEETLFLLGAVIVGGAGNRFGVLLGALLVPVVLSEGGRLLPSIGTAGTTEALQFSLVGLVIIAFMWFRRDGIVPERRRRFGPAGDPVPAVALRRRRGGPPPVVPAPRSTAGAVR